MLLMTPNGVKPVVLGRMHFASGKIESRTDRIRGIGTRILREGEDADFGAGNEWI